MVVVPAGPADPIFFDILSPKSAFILIFYIFFSALSPGRNTVPILGWNLVCVCAGLGAGADQDADRNTFHAVSWDPADRIR